MMIGVFFLHDVAKQILLLNAQQKQNGAVRESLGGVCSVQCVYLLGSSTILPSGGDECE